MKSKGAQAVAEFRARNKAAGGRRIELHLPPYGADALAKWIAISGAHSVNHAVTTALAQAVRSKESNL